jgi:hypothetical protein
MMMRTAGTRTSDLLRVRRDDARQLRSRAGREATRFLMGGTTREADAPASRDSSDFTAKCLLISTF